ncbi:hypothetical protein CFP71_17670 [Amycolatopsis thailandensis]|uniref:Uncharacterized protein n=1 Tax=Amycolatopsis thailandensis TaxID=589330 RepID=A0A229S9A8_9PSEU|nr:hypothetical protein CFP71_17670 [Amycolatopsis thailandensis]
MKASFPTFRVVKEAFTDTRVAMFAPDAPPVTSRPREGLLHAAQPRKLDLHASPKYMKAPFLAPGARKGAFMYLSGLGDGRAKCS